MKILIIGDGFVGSNIINYFIKKHDVIIGSRNNKNCYKNWHYIDITNKNETSLTITILSPDVIINAAGIKDVGYCEKNESITNLTNNIGNQNLSSISNKLGCKFIYISTDLVFYGDKGCYKENDNPQPYSVYGKTKLLGEDGGKLKNNNMITLRTAGLYSNNSPLLNFAYNKLSKNEILESYINVYNTPTFISDLTDSLDFIINNDDIKDVLHVTGSERINRYNFFKKFAETFGFDNNLVKPCMNNNNNMLLRPDTSLDNIETSKLLNIKFKNIQEGFDVIKNNKNNCYE